MAQQLPETKAVSVFINTTGEAMLRNYLKIALRNLLKYRLYSAINISGLTVGMLCFLSIFLYVQDELSYDRFHTNIDRLYRLNFYAKLGDQLAHTSASPKPAGPVFKESMPEIEAFCRLRSWGTPVVRYENQSFKEEKVIYADSTLFQVFTFTLLEGDPATALTAPNSVVLTRQAAEKYFGTGKALGRTLRFGDEACMVTGVVADMPQNAHFRYDFFRSLSGFNLGWDDNWGSTNYHNYFLLRKGADPAALSEKATAIFISNFAPILKQYLNTSWDEFLRAGNYARVEFFPVRDIHLHSDLDEELGANGDIKYVYIFAIIGLFILALACINFMNLSTARSAIRAREVGVRKAIGALRSDLARQFLSESILLALLALVLALGGLYLVLPAFNNLAGKALDMSAIYQPGFLAAALVLAGLIGLAAGSYPAFFLSAFQPVNVLKSGTVSAGGPGRRGAGSLRSGLVVFQFFTTSVLLVGSLVVYQQLQYIQHKKLGFNKENVLILEDTDLLGDKQNSFKATLLQHPAVRHVSYCNFVPASAEQNTSTVVMGRNVTQENTILSNNCWADHDYARTLGLEIAGGRDFAKDLATDSSAVLVNERLARSFGYPQKPVLGQVLSFPRDEGKLETHTIVGVVKDFNFASLRTNIEPLAIFMGGWHNNLCIRFETSNADAFIKDLRADWDEMAPGQPFAYSFLDERFQRLYAAETRVGQIIGVFAFLAVFIACIGLFGLATFTVQQRSKEIGVRKVLGASTAGIVGLLSKDFLKLVMLALVIAVPVAWYGMHRWLQDFAYRIDLQWWVFVLAGMAAVLLAFLTVGFQSMKAALANPVRALRSE